MLEPVGTAPGLVVPPAEGREGPTVVVLPGPPRELQPMWEAAVETESFRAVAARAGDFETAMLRLFGIPESEIAATLRDARAGGIDIDRMEITTCLRRGEIEIVTRHDGADAGLYDQLAEHIRARHGDTLFSDDGSTVDEQVAGMLDGPPQRTIAVAESCTGGLLAARLTAPAGASARMLGGVVVYANSAKEDMTGVDPALIERAGAVSAEVAEALADGAVERFGADVGVGVTGIAGPDGGTPEKPVGTVWFSVALADGRHLTRRVLIPGDRESVRDRSTTIAMHLVRRALRGEIEDVAVGEPAARASCLSRPGGRAPGRACSWLWSCPSRSGPRWRTGATPRWRGSRACAPWGTRACTPPCASWAAARRRRSPGWARWCAAAWEAPSRRLWRWARRCGCRAVRPGCWPWG